MTVKELINQLEKMPGDAKVLAHQPEAGGFLRVEKISLEDGKVFENKFGKKVVILDKKPFKKEPKEPVEEQVENLCPDCTIYCQERFIDGICK